jgi:hypothetical protein
MEDDLKIKKLEEDLSNNKNGRRPPHKNMEDDTPENKLKKMKNKKNGRRPQKTTFINSS